MSDYVSLATYKSSRGHPFKLFVNRMHSRVHGRFLFNFLFIFYLGLVHHFRPFQEV